ncbi:signal peptidase II [Xanthobacter sp. TB0136]|uniref:signal peptidase II n=1 Tax=Xanthobacter sp. TB0136 TaxID=3459177 RepID=UPI00403A665F
MTSRAQLTRYGIILAVLTLILDQASKVWVLTAMQEWRLDVYPVTPFFDLVVLWNYGISYGLFQQADAGRWVLVVISLVAALVFAIWLTRAHRRMEAIALGLLIGGALGNAIDRAIYGAVFDFISLHAYGFHWYVFNVADIAVVVGVILLLIDAFRGHASKSPPSDTRMESKPEIERKP